KHYQDPKEEKSQKRIKEQKCERTLQTINEFLNKYRTEKVTKKKKISPPTIPKNITMLLNKNIKEIKHKQEQEFQNKQFVKDQEELIIEITNIENEYEAIQRIPKTKLEELYHQILTIPTLSQEI
ncbi:29741_t:CDS:1, partial [Racocetra persica]